SRLAMAGVALSAALLFQPSLVGRAVMLACAAAAAWLSGRRLSPLTTVLVMAGIVAANLVVPIGRKLGSIGPFAITEIALADGLRKAVTFEALMFISKACLGPGLRLPGRFGAFFAEALRGYDRILERKASIRLDGFLKSIDEILVSVYYGTETGEDSAGDRYSTSKSAIRRGDIALALAVAAAYLPLFIG
ncbi:MAG: hypothetical protein KKB59_07390, partial [Spirochaetes bacterium]|nr:hypothetical protein [Spirochaetota bacterium]